jgi:rod shape-determining protein MreD
LAWVFLGLEKGLRDALSIGTTGIAPSFVFGLLTFVAIAAPRSTVMWTAILLGVLMDLIFEVPLRQASVTMIGPHAIAYVVACQLILSMRGVMIRRNPFTLGFLACLGGVVAFTTLVAIYTARSLLGTPLAWDARHELFAGLGSSVYTGIVAIVLALVLFPIAGPLGLPNQQQRRFGVARR